MALHEREGNPVRNEDVIMLFDTRVRSGAEPSRIWFFTRFSKIECSITGEITCS